MILKKSLLWKAIAVIIILAIVASSLTLAITTLACSQKDDTIKSVDTSNTVNNPKDNNKTPHPSEKSPAKTKAADTTSTTNSAYETSSSSPSVTQTPTAGFHGVGILKSADPVGYVNENVTYRINVYNPSDFNLTSINVTDTMLKLNATIPFMAAGNKTGVTYLLTRTVLANDSNPLINTASVEAVDSEGVRSTATAQAKTTIVQRWLVLNKTGPAFAHELDSIKYTITVKNVGNATLSNVTVADALLGFSWLGDLSVNETNVFSLTYVVPKTSPDPLINKATATADLFNGSKTYAEASWTVDILHPRLYVNTTVTPEKACKVGNVTYSIVVTNTGDAALYNLTVVNSVFGSAPAELLPTSLLPGQSVMWSFNASAKVSTVSITTATGVDAIGKTVKAYDKVGLCFNTCDHDELKNFKYFHYECDDD